MTGLEVRYPVKHQCKVVSELTSACAGKCPDCYQRLPGKRKGREDLPLYVFKKNIFPYVRKHRRELSFTELGGEPCLHPEFLPITDGIIACKPSSLDIFTGGALFREPNREFWEMARQPGPTDVCVVLSYDRHHRQGLQHADSLLEAGFAKIRGLWMSGSKVGFAIKSTRFGEEPEEEIELKIHAACAKHNIPIEVNCLDWGTVFRWAKDYLVRIALPARKKYFEITNSKVSRLPLQRIEFVLKDESGLPPIWSVREAIDSAQEKTYSSAKYGFEFSYAGPKNGTAIQDREREHFKNCLIIDRAMGSTRQALAQTRTYPENQIYISSSGMVYSNPLAMLRYGATSPYDIRNMPLGEIARKMYG